MTVKELIKELQQFPEELSVEMQIQVDGGGIFHIAIESASIVEYRGDCPSIVAILTEEW